MRIQGNNILALKLLLQLVHIKNNKYIDNDIDFLQNADQNTDNVYNRIMYFDLWDELGIVAFQRIAELAELKTFETLSGMRQFGYRILQNATYYDYPDIYNRLLLIK
jgi:hypothetical protein